MKKTIRIKNALQLITFAGAILLITSCENNQKSKDSKTVSENHNDSTFDNKRQKDDAQFLVDVAEINLKAILLGQLAQQKGQSSHVKELGEMMEEAHTKSQKELTSLAKSKSINVPTTVTDDARDAYSKLNEKSADDFDEAYADKMVNGHKDAIDIYEKAAKDANDSTIKSMALGSLPELYKHLGHSIKCQKKCNSNKINKYVISRNE